MDLNNWEAVPVEKKPPGSAPSRRNKGGTRELSSSRVCPALIFNLLQKIDSIENTRIC